MKKSSNGFSYEDVQLAFDQSQALREFQKLIEEAAENREQGLLLAQVFPEDNYMRVAFLPKNEAVKIMRILEAKTEVTP